MNKENKITVVSGLPRSGTSLLMQMLQAGGMDIYTDNRRKADESNPRGYFEHEAVKGLMRDASFLTAARGRAVKVISYLLRYLPDDFQYDILFMRRNLDEIILSQNRMLSKLNEETDDIHSQETKSVFLNHLHEVHKWLHSQKNIRFIYIDHRAVLSEPYKTAERIAGFLEKGLDSVKMASVVNPSFHRSKREP